MNEWTDAAVTFARSGKFPNDWPQTFCVGIYVKNFSLQLLEENKKKISPTSVPREIFTWWKTPVNKNVWEINTF